jgi:error-prone DNA polymerase
VIHLQVASGYSLRYGTASPAALVERTVDQGVPSLALTDRDGLAGAIRFGSACQKAGIAPIIGVDLALDYVDQTHAITPAKGGRARDVRAPRILLYAKGRRGWSSLCRVVSLAHALAAERDQRGQPRVTPELLAPFMEDLFLLHSAQSPLAAALSARRPDLAERELTRWRDLVPAGQMGIAITSHQGPGDGALTTAHAARMLGFAEEHHIPAIATNAVRYLNRDDAPIADLFDAIRRLVPLDKRHVDRKTAEGYLKSPEHMREVIEEVASAAGSSARALIATTMQWADHLALDPAYDLGIGSIHLPEPQVVGCADESEMAHSLRERSMAGLRWRFGDRSDRNWSVIEERLNDELRTITTLGYESYFLTVADVAAMAQERGIRVAARGSGAGSLVCHALGISGVDPLEHHLLMERFCSPLRSALPDIDIDVESARRLELYDAVFARYAPPGSWPTGIARCAAVSMVDTYRARHALRDTGAALGLPKSEIDMLAKSFPHIRARDLRKAMRDLPELNTGLAKTLGPAGLESVVALAERLDALPRHLAMHPCAVVISDGGLLDRVPTEMSAQGYPMVAFDKDDVEEIGLLKLDILGVRMQSAIAYSLEQIATIEEEVVDIDRIPFDDERAFDLIRSTHTLGLFQVESPGQRELVGKFAPETFDDLIIDISLFRPGPVKSDMVTPFLQARQGWRDPMIIHPDLAPIVASTQGVVVFHEQVIEIIAQLTGCSLAQGDEYRRALGDPEGQARTKAWFFPAARLRGYSEEVIERIWQVLAAFASFGFCKAHAAAFALPTYQSAWLKAHHPAAFLAGVLTHDPGMYPKRLILADARRWGIEILPLDIHRSGRDYLVERVEQGQALAPTLSTSLSTGRSLLLPDGRGYGIRIGFADVHGMSAGEIESLLAARPYLDLADFVRRSGVSRPVTERLILIGAFDSLHGIATGVNSRSRSRQGVTRRDLLMHHADLHTWQRSHAGQLALDVATPELHRSGLPEMTIAERVRAELDVLGMDVSCHVIDFYRAFLAEMGIQPASHVVTARSRTPILVAGVKVATQTPPMRSGRRVVFLTLDDGTGCADATFFEDAQGPYAATLFQSWLLVVRGEVRRTGPRGVSLRATGCWDLPTLHQAWRDGGMEAVRAVMADEPVTLREEATIGAAESRSSRPVMAASPTRKIWHTSPGSSGQ